MSSIYSVLQKQIVVLDGAMGTMIQQQKLTEEDYRAKQFKDWPVDLKGNNDLLCLTQSELLKHIHTEYVQAGAQIITTNTFNAQRISMLDYGMENYCEEINREAARIACEVSSESKLPIFVAGSVGPMNKTLSMSSDVNDPAYRAMGFSEAAFAYQEQIQALIEGGVDLLLIETVFDTLNAKAAVWAAHNLYAKYPSMKRPIMLSGTIVDKSGRTLSGQTPLAFIISLDHTTPLLSMGLNCSLGADLLAPYVEEVAANSTVFVSAHPNAGLPNELGEYDETPEQMAKQVEGWFQKGWINIIGGCCGTTPDHIRAISETAKRYMPRKLTNVDTTV